jgi:hypothetical protein
VKNKPWLDFLDEQERAAVDAVQEDLREWRRLKLYDWRVKKQYSAEPDPNGESAAMLKRLQAAYNAETKYRSIGTQ